MLKMFNNPYVNSYSNQSNLERINSINNQIAELEMKKAQAYMPQPITQNFQISPTNGVIKYANSIDDVKKEVVMGDTPYFSNDMSVVWIKNSKGEIKSYELKEIIQKDDKDMLIEVLMQQIEDLKKGNVKDEQSNSKYVSNAIKNEKSSKGKSNSKFND